MRQTETELWESLADRRRLEVDDVVHVTASSGLRDQLAHDGDALGTHAAEVCERELIAGLGLEVCDVHLAASPAQT